MILNASQIADQNKTLAGRHQRQFSALAENLTAEGYAVDTLVKKIGNFKVATPSWALGTGGTRFGRFPGGGEPATLTQKMEDISMLKDLSRQTESVSLHIPWDLPKDALALKQQAQSLGLKFDCINSNTFQDQPGNKDGLSYKFGSLCNSQAAVREKAIAHNIDCIKLGDTLGSKALTVWLADGTNYPGQANFRTQFEHVLSSLQAIYKALPQDWYMFTEHKPFEPNFYSSVVNDWGSSLALAQKTGERCLCLVDLGHHLPNCNIEQVVSRVLMEGRLAGFHFNDSKYSDDDLTAGSLKPYQLFLIFNELLDFMEDKAMKNPDLAWMIDASHNTKDPLEDLLQSLEAISLAYAQALLIDRNKLRQAQLNNDVVFCQEILQGAFRTDVRPLLAEARLRNGGAISPVQAYRGLMVRKSLVAERGERSISSGL
jgi:L-rhamnose isomerase / sugar isomerase